MDSITAILSNFYISFETLSILNQPLGYGSQSHLKTIHLRWVLRSVSLLDPTESSWPSETLSTLNSPLGYGFHLGNPIQLCYPPNTSWAYSTPPPVPRKSRVAGTLTNSPISYTCFIFVSFACLLQFFPVPLSFIFLRDLFFFFTTTRFIFYIAPPFFPPVIFNPALVEHFTLFSPFIVSF